jgi:hypothetical protein
LFGYCRTRRISTITWPARVRAFVIDSNFVGIEAALFPWRIRMATSAGQVQSILVPTIISMTAMALRIALVLTR